MMSVELKHHIGHDVIVYTVERHGWSGVVYEYTHPQYKTQEAIISCTEDDYIEDVGRHVAVCTDCDIELELQEGEVEW